MSQIDDPNPPAEPSPAEKEDNAKHDAMRLARRMVLWTVGVVLTLLVLGALLAPPDFMQMRWPVLLVLAVGIVATVVLAALLMAASFYSDRAGHDDEPSGH